MNMLSYSQARDALAQTMESVCDHHEPVVITRENAPAVVLISLEDFEGLEETAYLLRTPANARRLVDSISELEVGGGVERDLVE